MQVVTGNTSDLAFSTTEPVDNTYSHELHVGRVYRFPASTQSIWVKSTIVNSQITITGFASSDVTLPAASDGTILPLSSLAQTLAYSNGLLSTITVSYGGNTYVQTMTYANNFLTGISQWIKQ